MKLHHKILFIILLIALSGAGIFAYLFVSKSSLHYNSGNDVPIVPSSSLRPLIINTQPGCGGGEVYTLNLYKQLRHRGHHASILVKKNSWLEMQLLEEKLPYYSVRTFKWRLCSNLKKIIHQESCNLIHCNTGFETPAALTTKNSCPVKVIISRHITAEQGGALPAAIASNVDGIICVSPEVEQSTRHELVHLQTAHAHIAFIAPLFDEAKFENISISSSKQNYFKTKFNIEVHKEPVILCLANIADDKNQSLLLDALDILLHSKNIPLHIIFAGRGDSGDLQKKSNQLGLEHNAHFVGHVANTPLLLAHADLKVFPSKREAFGIVLLEAALMKKPLIGASGTGSENTIIHRKTGLLFENNNAASLADTIVELLNNPTYAHSLALNAYNHVRENFCSKKTIEKIENFYRKVSGTSSTSTTF